MGSEFHRIIKKINQNHMKAQENMPTPHGQANEETIQSWKATYRKVLAVTVTDNDEIHAVYFRRPTMEILSMVEKIRKTDSVKAASLLFDNCWIGGSDAIKDDAVLKMAAIAGFNTTIDQCRVEAKNL